MSFSGETPQQQGDGAGPAMLLRAFVVAGVALAAAEIALVALPLYHLLDLSAVDRSELSRIAAPVLAGLTLVWLAALGSWLRPIRRAAALRRRGARVSGSLAAAAYAKLWRVPLRALVLRTTLWIAAALAVGIFLIQYAGWSRRQLAELVSLTALHAFAISAARAVWYAAILSRVRQRVFPVITPLQTFADGHSRRLLLVAVAVAAGALSALSAFLYYVLPISDEQYLQIQTYFPAAVAGGLLCWALLSRRWTRILADYFERELGDGDASVTDELAAAVYRRAQALPYRLGLASLVIWLVVVAGAVWAARARLRFELDDTVLIAGIAAVIALGAAIYESLWHRQTMRPLLSHLTVRHTLPVRTLRPVLTLRTKLLLSLGGVVMFACGLALLWGFVQYKSLVTSFVSKQADLSLAWLRSEVQAAAAAGGGPPTSAMVREVLEGIDGRSPDPNAVFYYLADAPDAEPVARGGGRLGAPRLPWYVVAQLKLSHDDAVEVGSLDLSGRRGRLTVSWQGRPYDLGAVAALYPNYQGRGSLVARPLRELWAFFLLLLGACAGIVILAVSQFVTPVRMLERRADGMARGELAEPVTSGGEGDEIGRLTFALEEMRRALRDRLRSTEEVNLDLERAVQRRTADLARKNRELAETLDKLTRAQDQLVRSEKMASIGQLVAGIAHEINNPVNAIVNTIGPLEEAIRAVEGDAAANDEAAADVRDMLRVVRRGAQRTKAIVQALHNYSRSDDERVAELDLERGLDDSLELLRHGLRQQVSVERRYGEVGRIVGHAGQLNQVFMNLLTNAAQAVAGREGGTIWLETAAVDEVVVIRIRDNGAGIPADVLPRIFDPFFTTKDVGEGSGLGLSIVHGIVERHGGSIEVDSEVGTGTVFTVTLPRANLG